jgi:hypothetical protein
VAAKQGLIRKPLDGTGFFHRPWGNGSAFILFLAALPISNSFPAIKQKSQAFRGPE